MQKNILSIANRKNILMTFREEKIQVFNNLVKNVGRAEQRGFQELFY